MSKIYQLIAVLITLTLSACASQPAYQAAKDNGYGYSETKLTDTQYRVLFKGRGSDTTKAMDYAMLRAAELTLEQGYDWFVVANKETLVDRQRTEPTTQVGFSRRYNQVRECGLVTCRTYTSPTTQFETGIFVGGTQKSQIESILDIQLGRGTRPDTTQSFDARQVKANLQPVASE